MKWQLQCSSFSRKDEILVTTSIKISSHPLLVVLTALVIIIELVITFHILLSHNTLEDIL